MAITKSFNKHTQTYYVYDTSYVWDETRQKKVQKRRCIGKWDPVQEKILPTGKRGRPNELSAKLAQAEMVPVSSADTNEHHRAEVFSSIATNLNILQSALSGLASDFKTVSELFAHEPLPPPQNCDDDKGRDEDGKAEEL